MSSKKPFYKKSRVLVSKPTQHPLSLSSPTPGKWQCPRSIMWHAFSQPTCLAFFSCSIAFVRAVTYSVLWQLCDARWPNSATHSQSSLGRRSVGETVPQHFSCGWANVHSPTRKASVSTYTQAFSQFYILFVPGLCCNYLKITIFSVVFAALHPFTNFLFCLFYQMGTKLNQRYTHTR